MFEWWEVVRSILGKGLAEILAVAAIAVFGFFATRIGSYINGWRDYSKRLSRAVAAVKRESTPAGPREGRGLWMSPPIQEATTDQHITALHASKVLVVANAKGGVGKTTTAANLGARLADVLPMPVLLVDLDFQGTLSSMATGQGGDWLPPNGMDSLASKLISGDLTAADIVAAAKPATGNPRLKIITAFYDLAQAENRVMIEWLLGDRKIDVRFRLAKLLHSNLVRQNFSLVIIDCPPRITTAAVQALAAGTHLLIPTIMDGPSGEAVITFVRQVENFKSAGLCPHIQYIGVVGSLQPPVGDIGPAMKRISDRLADFRQEATGRKLVDILDPTTFFPTSTHFRNAVSNGGIAYIVMKNSEGERDVKERIVALADHVRREMKL
jgi:cellulose biosynthesis protein BcsQ